MLINFDWDTDPLFDRSLQRQRASAWSARSHRGMVVSANYHATDAGLRVLEAGGNAIDAAVATSLALGVCEPAGSGLGGMGMLLVYRADEKRARAHVASCRAPRAATPELVGASPRYRGHRAVAVPSLAALLDHLLGQLGTMSAAELVEPAVQLARKGFAVSGTLAALIRDYERQIRSHSAADTYLDANGAPLARRTTLRQPLLADTLEALGRDGLSSFYRGDIARSMLEDMREHDGFVGADDLASPPPVVVTDPLEAPLRGDRVLTVGPPAGGLTLLRMAMLWDELERRSPLPADDAQHCLRLAAVIRRARADRTAHRLTTGTESLGGAATLLDPADVSAAATELADGLGVRSADGEDAGDGDDGETTHFIVADHEGNVVSMTQSIERSFGSAEVSPRLGFLYNGYLRAFKVQKREHPHYLVPGAPARSNAAPTLVLRGDEPVAALGSTGSERLASGILQALLKMSRGSTFEMTAAPRMHAAPNGRILIERDRFPEPCVSALEGAGNELADVGPYAFAMGGLQVATMRDGMVTGAGDPRRDSWAAAPEGRPSSRPRARSPRSAPPPSTPKPD